MPYRADRDQLSGSVYAAGSSVSVSYDRYTFDSFYDTYVTRTYYVNGLQRFGFCRARPIKLA